MNGGDDQGKDIDLFDCDASVEDVTELDPAQRSAKSSFVIMGDSIAELRQLTDCSVIFGRPGTQSN